MATKSLYVGNLPYSADAGTLTKAFEAFGGTNVRIVEGRGFGFIDVADDQMDAAIEAMNGKQLDGRTLSVNEARPRESGPRSGGGGGGSYGGGGGGRGGSGGGGRGGYGGGNSGGGNRNVRW